MPKTLPKTINLLEPIMAPEDAWTKIYKWVTKVGRFLLVGTALIVLVVFFSRFVLDRQNNDLTEQINEKITTILGNEVVRRDEYNFRNYQALLTDISKVSQAQVINSSRIGAILSSIPANFELKTFNFSSSRVSLSFTTANFDDIGKYTAKLSANGLYQEVASVVSKGGEGAGGIDFSVSFTIKK